MALLKIAKMGHPVLRKRASELSLQELGTPRIKQLILDMIETMRDLNGAGIAAPQVHHSFRIMVIEVKDNSRYPNRDSIELQVFINPKFTFKSDIKVSDFEGCLSIDGLRAKVPRHKEIILEALNEEGLPVVIRDSGFLAIALQHEMDHLEGKLFLDHVEDYSTMTQEKEYHQFHV
jgi:peptide deformylase